MYYDNFSGALEASIELGFDANWTIYAMMQLEPDPDSNLGVVWHDAFGRVWEMGSDDKGNMSVNYTRALCDTEERWEAWVERKAPLFDRWWPMPPSFTSAWWTSTATASCPSATRRPASSRTAGRPSAS